MSSELRCCRTPNDAPEAFFLRSNRRIDQNYFRFKAKWVLADRVEEIWRERVSAARADIGRYLEWFNTHRAHSRLNGATPQQAYLALASTLEQAA